MSRPGDVCPLNEGYDRCGSSGATPRPGSRPTRRSPFRLGDERDPQPGRLGRLPARRHRGARGLEPGRGRRARPEIFPQGRRAGAPEEGRGERRPLLPVALRARRGGARRRCPRTSASAPRSRRKQVFDRLAGSWTYWGWKGGYFSPRRTRRPSTTSCASCSPTQMVRAELAAMVQHRPALGLRHRRAEPGPLLRRLQDRQADEVEVGLRASAAACLLHPGRRGRPRQRGRHHGPVGARGAPVQIRLRHRLELLARCAARASGCPAAARSSGLMSLPQDRRPRGRRHQVGRHDAPRRQDGRRRRRPPRHRDLHRLEGEGGAEGRRARHRLQDRARSTSRRS